MKGYVQVYTGPGKGKTTAALGLTVRAASAGLNIFFTQFVKRENKSINNLASRYSNVTTQNFGRYKFINNEPNKKDKKLAQKGLKTVQNKIKANEFDLIVLDEINIAIHYELLPIQEVLNLIRNHPPNQELILTGRHAHEQILQEADLVTKMTEVKHYYRKGYTAREGIEY